MSERLHRPFRPFRSFRRWLLALGALGLVLVVGLAALVWQAGRSDGLVWLTQRLVGAQWQGAQGSLWQGLQADRLVLDLPGLRIEAEGIRWEPVAVGPRRVEGGLQLQRLRLTPQGPPGEPLTESRLRAAMRAPVALRLAPLRVQRFEWADRAVLESVRLDDARLADGELHLAGLDGAWQRPDGALRLHGQAALTDALRLEMQAELPAHGLEARVRAAGPLAALPVQLRLRHRAESGRADRDVGPAPDEATLEADAQVALFRPQPLQRLSGTLQALNPQRLNPAWPAGRWSGSLGLVPVADRLRLQADLRNAAARRVDEGGWPVRALRLDAALDPAVWARSQLAQLDLELGPARGAAGRVSVAPVALPTPGRELRAELRVDAVRLRDLHAGWPALQLGGVAEARQSQLGQGPLALRAQLRAVPVAGAPAALGAGWRLDGAATWQAGGAAGQDGGERLVVDELQVRELTDSPARLTARGTLQWQPALRTELTLEAQEWRLVLPPWSAPSQITAQARVTLAQPLRPGQAWQGAVSVHLREGTRLADQAVQGEAQWRAEAGGATWQVRVHEAAVSASSTAEGNWAEARGRQGPLLRPAALAEATAWQPDAVRWQLPRLARLQTLAAPWVSPLQGSLEGRWERSDGGAPWGTGQVRAQNLRMGNAALDALQADLRADQALRLQVQRAEAPGLLLREAQLTGSLANGGRLSLRAVAELAALREAHNPPRSLVLEVQGSAPRQDPEGWGMAGLNVHLAEAPGPTWIDLADAQLRWSPGDRALQLAPTVLRVAGERLQLTEARVAWPIGQPRNARLRLNGQPALAPWLQLAQPGAAWRGDLRARFELELAQAGSQAAQLRLQVQREQGDLQLGKEALGLRQVRMDVRHGSDRSMAVTVDVGGDRLGVARLQAQTDAGGQALRGDVEVQLPALEALQPWLRAVSPGLLLAGSAQAQLQLSGSLAAPQGRGTATAQLSRALHAPSGLGVGSARLRLRLADDRLVLDELRAEGLGANGGSVQGEGELRWTGLRADQLDRLQGSLTLRAEQWRMLQRFDRRLVASGSLRAELLPRLLRVRGQLVADEGAFEIGRPDAPTLDDDVRVLRESLVQEGPPRRRAEPTAPRLQRDVDVSVDLGQRLRIAGRGLSSRLTGSLRFVEQGGRPLLTTGLIELNGGRYRAYGQNLEIETGVLRFTGLLDNPRLDILAIRPNLEARVGVQVNGSAENPRVRLYSEPEMPDADKLAWLLLGRAPDELGRNDTALLQRAALALLAGEGSNPATDLMDRLGLTELSVSQSDEAGTTLRLGAQLGRRWTLGYERSLEAATGSWQLVYRLGQRFRLRAQSGDESAVDLLWVWRFD